MLPSFASQTLLLWCVSLLSCSVFADVVPDIGGQVRNYELTITWETHAPDGVAREMALINGQFPGPVLELDQGDVVEVLVHNKMPSNTTVHFHGIEMLGTPWSDGVPGITQRQIKTGGSFLYRWKATQYGSYWYHAHQRGQIDDGLYGPIVIHPKNQDTPFRLIANDTPTLNAMIHAERHVKPLILSDFRHVTSEEGWSIVEASGIETPCYDSILFNGKGKVNCWSKEYRYQLESIDQATLLAVVNDTLTDKGCLPANTISKVLAASFPANLSVIPPEIFDVCTPTNASEAVLEYEIPSCASAKWVALDIIGTFGLLTGSFSIDGHSMYVYAVDGSYIEPLLVDAISVTNGDRFSVLLKLDTPGNYTIRMASTVTAQMMAGYATLRVTGDGSGNASSKSEEAYVNDVGVNTTAGVVFFQQSAMKSFPPDNIATLADETFKLAIEVAGASYQWALNTSTYPAQFSNGEPMLFDPEPYISNNVTITTQYGEWVDLIFIDKTFPMPPHPIHKHGTKMWLIGYGSGDFNYSTVAEAAAAMPENFNLVDPPKRDTIATPNAITGQAWMAVRYQAKNPGAWFIHCHIESHMNGGMSMAIQDAVDRWPVVPEEYVNYH